MYTSREALLASASSGTGNGSRFHNPASSSKSLNSTSSRSSPVVSRNMQHGQSSDGTLVNTGDKAARDRARKVMHNLGMPVVESASGDGDDDDGEDDDERRSLHGRAGSEVSSREDTSPVMTTRTALGSNETPRATPAPGGGGGGELARLRRQVDSLQADKRAYKARCESLEKERRDWTVREKDLHDKINAGLGDVRLSDLQQSFAE